MSSPGSQISNGAVNAIAYDGITGHVYAGGTFTNAGGNANADFLAVWDGTSWAPFCAPITATVYALQIIGRKLYVAGAFADGAPVAAARGDNGRTGAATVKVRVLGVKPDLMVTAPRSIRRTARVVKLRVASTVPAVLRAGGRRFRVDRTSRSISVPVRPGRKRLILRLAVNGGGGRVTYAVKLTRT